VHDHAGGVEHAPQRRPLAAREALVRAGDEVGLAPGAGPQLLPALLDRGPRRRDRQRVGRIELGRQAVDRRQRAERIHG
jgi:hypothetical protein